MLKDLVWRGNTEREYKHEPQTTKKMENNRMEKSRDVFKKIRDTKETFHAKMGTIKDRNGMDQKKQKILRRGGKNIQRNCTKKIFTTKIITMV